MSAFAALSALLAARPTVSGFISSSFLLSPLVPFISVLALFGSFLTLTFLLAVFQVLFSFALRRS